MTNANSAVKLSDRHTTRLNESLPNWALVEGCLQRTYTTSSWKGTMMLVNVIGHLAEAAWHHPDLAVSYKNVVVKLFTHSDNAITDKDFDLAEKIERVVQWQPATEPGSLPGTPADARHAYVHYDET